MSARARFGHLVAVRRPQSVGRAAQSGAAGRALLVVGQPLQAVELIPLLWTNDADGGAGGCCVVGAAARHRMGEATLWLALGFGTGSDGGVPGAVEAAVEVRGGAAAFRSLHGRSGVAAFYPLVNQPNPASYSPDRLSVGFSSVWMFDDSYVKKLPLFDCPANAPAVPCEPLAVPYPWSEGRDNAVAAELAWGEGSLNDPMIAGSVVAGLEIAGGDHNYLRGEVRAEARGALGQLEWKGRLAGGWASGGAPMQRRFLLYGADPITRWLNPYLDAEGALFSDIPYVVPGGPHLRAYQASQPLVKRYISGLVDVSRHGETPSGFWAAASAFLEAAWTPAIPGSLGPEGLNESGSLLFDWRELPFGEDRARGQFLARSLDLSPLWADAGLMVGGGYRLIGIWVSLPVWASEPALANEPIRGDENSALALRWTLSVAFYPYGTPWGE